MVVNDEFCEYYKDLLDGTYDSIDRIVINAYFRLAQSNGGFRTWWRMLMGSDDSLDNTHLMRFAGRFSRRIHAYAKEEGIPLIHCQPGERKHEIAEQYIPQDSSIDAGKLETWPLPSKVGAGRVAGIDINQRRMRAVMEGVIALSANPRGFTASELAAKVRERGNGDIPYQSRQASYDLKKLRGKELVCSIQHSRRYQTTLEGLRTMAAFIVLREKVLIPLLANGGKRKTGPKPRNRSLIDIHYDNIQIEMQKIFQTMNIAA
jgi:DNA-binding transcriptional ArsR family regulator